MGVSPVCKKFAEYKRLVTETIVVAHTGCSAQELYEWLQKLGVAERILQESYEKAMHTPKPPKPGN